MDEKTKKQIELHSAGATIRHSSPFAELEHYSNENKLEAEFIKKWCVPFYMFGINKADEFIRNFEPIKAELNLEVVKKLLGDFNWRTRIVGAYFASIMEFKTVEDIIGIHLLKSQVCYAGNGYCLTLAKFNTQNGIEYLKKYLDYYLTRKDLHYDQTGAMMALKWTDKINGTNVMDDYLELYQEWTSRNYTPDINTKFQGFEQQMNNLKRIKTA
ncbi:hypothetical protein BTO05_01115 [Winogradskyella sp. PC-19]|jgi:hypothetical protein|uniref:DUF6000 family protein n=1 Tax=Winogradskyella sp. PC-19 TaxID=754417 RepID=UPI000B3D0775|nr:DUF6000 family protein [Winogradskyella sp. PC-19]ARV08307.1 hypothetical protein BTO05_01115 [Winogradskyella sp. PC-19]